MSFGTCSENSDLTSDFDKHLPDPLTPKELCSSTIWITLSILLIFLSLCTKDTKSVNSLKKAKISPTNPFRNVLNSFSTDTLLFVQKNFRGKTTKQNFILAKEIFDETLKLSDNLIANFSGKTIDEAPPNSTIFYHLFINNYRWATLIYDSHEPPFFANYSVPIASFIAIKVKFSQSENFIIFSEIDASSNPNFRNYFFQLTNRQKGREFNDVLLRREFMEG